MAHNLSDASGTIEMFWYGDRPWHGLGVEVKEALTAEEAIKAAGLDWTVEKREIFFEKEAGVFESANAYATVRTDINTPLGIVGKNYKPIQNVEAFSFMDSLTFSEEAKYHTAGALFGGEKTWILAKLPGHLVVKDEDIVDKYLLLYNAHDGKMSMKVLFSPIRVVCWNTLMQAVRAAQTTVNVAHTGDVQRKVTEAQRILGIAVNYFKDLEEAFKAFAVKELTQTGLAKYLETVMPGDTTRVKNIREKIHELYESGAGSEYSRGTLWGGYNAITEYVDHFRTDYIKKPDRYLETITLGSGLEIKTRAYQEAIKIITT